ncbi:MAG: ABC transporter ATP-binding protein [Jiangellales bacterium]
MASVISVSGLAKRYGEIEAVRDVSFDVVEGEIFGLLGPNGAGKTTTVECVQGLRDRDAGHVSVLGLDPQAHPRRLRTHVGSQLQESSLPHRMKVSEALELFSSFQPDGPPWRSVMDQWGLAEKARSSFGSLSGGQRQRLLVALALVNDPEVVFLDEMTTGLDPAARRATWDLIEQVRQAGTTVVLVTHFMDEATRLCDRLAVVNRGTVVASGTPSQLIADHQDGVTVRFTVPSPAPALDLGFLSRIDGVTNVELSGRHVEVRGAPTIVALVGQALVANGAVPHDMDVVRPSLEDVYLRLVGGEG